MRAPRLSAPHSRDGFGASSGSARRWHPVELGAHAVLTTNAWCNSGGATPHVRHKACATASSLSTLLSHHAKSYVSLRWQWGCTHVAAPELHFLERQPKTSRQMGKPIGGAA